MEQTKTKSQSRPAGQLKEELGAYFQACSQACAFNGAVLVGYHGEVLFSGASGYANKEHKVLNSTKSKFRLASVTKPITAAAVLILQEKGKLKVTDAISKHLKWAPAHWKKITIHHLLTHTSGIPTYADSPTYNRARHIDADELVEQVVMYPLEFEPGTKFNYSDSNYFLLGILILTKSAKVYKTFLKENIFDPIGMKDSGVDENLATLPNRAMGYARNYEGALVDAAYTLVSNEYAAGDLYSTVEDLWLFDRALSNAKILSGKSIRAMLKPDKGSYAYGWQVFQYEKLTAYSHSGGTSGFTSLFERIPSDDFCMAVLSNVDFAPVHLIGDGLRSIVFDMKHETPQKYVTITADPSTYDDYEGRYELEPGVVIAIAREGDYLVAQPLEKNRYRLMPCAKDQFFYTQFYAAVTFSRDKDGSVTHLILHRNGANKRADRIKGKSK